MTFLDEIPKRMRGKIELPSPLSAKSACWKWIGGVNKPGQFGYGQARYKGKVWRVHRLAYHLTHGGIPDGMMVLHRCDSPRCCNPDHLFIGTCQDNKNDEVSKDRQSSKLTKTDVRWIRMYGRRMPVADVARAFGISRAHTYRILDHAVWKHVPLSDQVLLNRQRKQSQNSSRG